MPEPAPRLAVVLIVDRRGHLLLQHRDEQAPRAANQWGMVGGHVEPGEDFDAAADRELLEETGVAAGPGDLVLWQEAEFAYSDGQDGTYRLYAGQMDLTDDDIVLGEGRAIVSISAMAHGPAPWVKPFGRLSVIPDRRFHLPLRSTDRARGLWHQS